MAGKLETAKTSQEAFRTLVATLKEDVEVQRDDYRILTAQHAEAIDKYNRVIAESNAEKAAFQARISDLEVSTRVWSRIERVC